MEYADDIGMLNSKNIFIASFKHHIPEVIDSWDPMINKIKQKKY